MRKAARQEGHRASVPQIGRGEAIAHAGGAGLRRSFGLQTILAGAAGAHKKTASKPPHRSR
ncbi:MAG: hypothetical protein V4764_13780 [Burkholderia sp.]